jgi:hypothetical protein
MIPVQSPLSLAVSRAAAEAELRRTEMSRSMSPDRVVELLNRQAEDAAASPLAYDQLLALALRTAARPGEFASADLDALRAPPDPLERHQVAREVFAVYQEAPFRAVLKAAPDQELRRGRRRVGRRPQSLAAWLRSAAELARGLWDHPALPIQPRMRGAMLGTVTALRRRADELAPRVEAGAGDPAPPKGRRVGTL